MAGKEELDLKKALLGVMQELNASAKDYSDTLAGTVAISKQLDGDVKKILSAQDQSAKIAEKQKEIDAEIAGLRKEAAKTGKQVNKVKLKELQAQKTSLKLSDARNKKLQLTKSALGDISDSIGESASKIEGFVGSLPGGGFLAKAFGIDDLSGAMDTAINKAGEAFLTAEKGTTSLSAGMKAFGGELMATLGPIGLIAAAVAGLVMVFNKVSHAAHDISDATGMTYAQSKALYKESLKVQASYGTQLAKVEDIVAVQKEMIAAQGMVGKLSGETAAEVADIGKAFGYGAQQAGKVQAAFAGMGVEAGAAADMQRELAAEAMKAGLNVGSIMQDIADSSAETAVFFGGNVKKLKKAAIEAGKLGVSLKTMAKVAEGLLDFESSISAQFELQALTGRQMNFDLARQLALEGDIAGATKEVLNQVGDIHDFNNMDYLSRKKLAEATGMSVEELQKSLIIQDKMGDLTSDQLATMNSLGLSAAEMENMSAKDLEKKLAQKQAADKMGASMESIKNTLVSALLPAAEALMGVFSVIAPILKVIGKLVGAILSPLTLIGSIINGTTDDLSGMQIVLGSILSIYGIYLAMRNKEAIMDKLRNSKIAKFFSQKNMIIAAEKLGLITANQKTLALQRQSMIENGQGKLAKTMNLTKNQGLATQLKNNAIKMKDWLAEKAHWGWKKATQGAQWAKEKAHQIWNAGAKAKEYAITAGHWIAEKAHLIWKMATEKGALAIQYAINAAKMVSNAISMGAIAPLMASAGAAIAAAIPAIFTGFGMIPFGLGIPLAFAAVAGLIALISSMSKGDDVLSPATGGSGYGSRVLFGPEGAISFNNKDTIVAGTDLFRANDAMFAPKGALKMDDGVVGGGGGSNEPAEANIVDFSNDAMGKLFKVFKAAQGGLFGSLFGEKKEKQEISLSTESITKLVAAQTIANMVPKPVMVITPVMTFETNPMTFSMMGAIGGLAGGMLGMFGGGGKKEEDPLITKMDEVVKAVENIELNLDGQKIAQNTRKHNSFVKR